MNIVLTSPLETVSGYGAHSRDLASALINLGYNVEFISMPWGATPKYMLDPENPVERSILERIRHPQDIRYKPDVYIQVTIPNEFNPQGVFNIGITAGIESTICRPEWIEGCNRMDLIITTSNFSKEGFINSSFKNEQGHILKLVKPIEVLFEGVDIEKYIKYTPEAMASINSVMDKVTEPFAFLFVGHWLQGNLGHDRKDVGMLVRSFMETFKMKRTRPALILKTSGAGFSVTERNIIIDKINIIQESIRAAGFGGKLPNVYLLNGELTDDEMSALYHHPKVKAMVTFTKGEGFGRPILEFSLTGKPILASAWSGHMDFLLEDKCVLLPGHLEKVNPSAINEFFHPESEWFTVNYPMAMQFMNNVYEHYDTHLQRSKLQKKHSLEHFSMGKMEERLKSIMDTYLTTTQSIPEIQLPKLQKLI